MRKTWFYLLTLLCFIGALVWYVALSNTEDNLKIIACNVGQGDAILITYKSQQILVDGGPDNKVLKCLSNNMSFWDREVEVIILTHPEKDHYAGLIDVLKTYHVKNLLTTGLASGNQDYQLLAKEVGSGRTKVISVKEDTTIRFGSIHFDVLWPSDDFLSLNTQNIEQGSSNILSAYTTNKNKNDFSIVSILSFGNFDALLTGDIENEISDRVAEELVKKNEKTIEYIKIPHHGSKNGLSQKLLDTISESLPVGGQVAVISAGKNNSYGHPHKEILEMLSKSNVKTLRTDLDGEIYVETDGNKYWLKKPII